MFRRGILCGIGTSEKFLKKLSSLTMLSIISSFDWLMILSQSESLRYSSFNTPLNLLSTILAITVAVPRLLPVVRVNLPMNWKDVVIFLCISCIAQIFNWGRSNPSPSISTQTIIRCRFSLIPSSISRCDTFDIPL